MKIGVFSTQIGTGGTGAEVIDPNSVESITDGIFRVLTDSGLRSRLVQRGLERARRHTWERAATATLDAYKHASRGRR